MRGSSCDRSCGGRCSSRPLLIVGSSDAPYDSMPSRLRIANVLGQRSLEQTNNGPRTAQRHELHRPIHAPSSFMIIVESIGSFFINMFEQTGQWFQMLWRTILWASRPPYAVTEWMRQMVRVGIGSVPVVFLTTMFTGMVMALQTFTGFQRVHAENFVGSVVARPWVDELSPSSWWDSWLLDASGRPWLMNRNDAE